MTPDFVLRTPSGPVRFRVNEEARYDEPVLVREEEMIPIEREPPDTGPSEHCCFCCAPTRMWTDMHNRLPGAQVACCETCAKTRQRDEVPTKKAWFASERKRHPHSYGWKYP